MSELKHLPLKRLDIPKDKENLFDTLKQTPPPPHLRTFCQCRKTNPGGTLCFWNHGFCSLLNDPYSPIHVLDAILLNQVNFERALKYILAYGRQKGWIK